MRNFSDYDPFAVSVWFFAVTGMAMFCNYPVLMLISLAGGILFFLVRNGTKHAKSHLFFFMLFVVLAIANPIVSHNGMTVLFVVNDSPVTLEAVLYGLNSAAMIVGVLYWFRSYTQLMTSDKLLSVTGRLSPKISLLLSMALRCVPMLRRQADRTADAQKAMGLFKDDNIIDDIHGNIRVFSAVTTWALENGITSADSMAARGFGTGRRTQMRKYKLRRSDIIFMAVTLGLLGVCVAAAAHGSFEFGFYPLTDRIRPDTAGKFGIAAYALLVTVPTIIETEAALKWRYLKSKI